MDDLPLPEVPQPILDALTAKRSRKAYGKITHCDDCEGTLANSDRADDRSGVAEQAREVALAGKALRHLGASYYDDYDRWVRVGMALSQLGDDGLGLWRAWSAQSVKFDADGLEAKWASFRLGAEDTARGRISLGTLFYLAMEEGWEGPSRAAGRFRPSGFTIELHWLTPEQPRRMP